MKKTILTAMALLLATHFIACNSASQTSDELTFSQSTHNDTLNIKVDTMNGQVLVDLDVLYPSSGKQAVVDSINQWLYNVVFVDNEGKPFLKPSGNTDHDLDLLSRRLQQGDSVYAREDLDDKLKYRNESPDFASTPTEYCYSLEVKKTYETPDYVTLTANIYMGNSRAAHGSNLAISQTFSKTDGHNVGLEQLGTYGKQELTDLIHQGLRRYFKETCEIEDSIDDQYVIGELLSIDADTYNHHFPLPAFSPFILKDGLHLLYQQYEIAPYAVGMPDVVIPLK